MNQFEKDRQIALARLDSKLELKRQWYMLGRATGDLAVVDISTELSWSCMTCICTPQTQGYKKLLDQASLLPIAAPWRPSHDTTVTTSMPAVPGGRRFGVVGGCAGRQRHDKTNVYHGAVGRMLETRTRELDHYVDRAPHASEVE